MTSVCNLWSSVQQYASSNQPVVTQWRVVIIERGTMQPRVSGSQLSGLAGDQQIHYYACAEVVTDGLMWMWWQVERNATIVLFGKNWLTSILFWALLAMIIWTISLIWYGSDQSVDKGVQIMDVALYWIQYATIDQWSTVFLGVLLLLCSLNVKNRVY